MSRSRFVELNSNPSNSQLSRALLLNLNKWVQCCVCNVTGLALAAMGKKNLFFSGKFYQMVNKIFILVHELSKSLHRLTVWYDMPVAKDGKQVVEF